MVSTFHATNPLISIVCQNNILKFPLQRSQLHRCPGGEARLHRFERPASITP